MNRNDWARQTAHDCCRRIPRLSEIGIVKAVSGIWKYGCATTADVRIASETCLAIEILPTFFIVTTTFFQ